MATSAMSYDFFFFNDTATTEIYTLSLHDALPICEVLALFLELAALSTPPGRERAAADVVLRYLRDRSEEHTSELQSPCNLVCRLLLEKKKKEIQTTVINNKLKHTRHILLSTHECV